MTDAFLEMPEVGVFFDFPLIFVNRSPTARAVTDLNLELVEPDPGKHIKWQDAECAYRLQFRFEREAGVNAQLSEVLAVKSDMPVIVRPKCALLLSTISGTATPAVTLVPPENGVVIRVRYREARKGDFEEKAKKQSVK